MKHEFSNEAPMLRLACAVAALSITLIIGGFIDFLAMGYIPIAETQHRPALIGRTQAVMIQVSQPGVQPGGSYETQ